MYEEIKTMEQYLCWLSDRRGGRWRDVIELEHMNMKDSPDYHRAVSAWAAYDAAIDLFQELMKNLEEKGSV